MVCVAEGIMLETILELERSFEDVDTMLLVGIEDNTLEELDNVGSWDAAELSVNTELHDEVFAVSREEMGTADINVENTTLDGTVFGDVELDRSFDDEPMLFAGTEDEESIWTCEGA